MRTINNPRNHSKREHIPDFGLSSLATFSRCVESDVKQLNSHISTQLQTKLPYPEEISSKTKTIFYIRLLLLQIRTTFNRSQIRATCLKIEVTPYLWHSVIGNTASRTNQQSLSVGPAMAQFWTSVADDGPELIYCRAGGERGAGDFHYGSIPVDDGYRQTTHVHISPWGPHRSDPGLADPQSRRVGSALAQTTGMEGQRS